MNKKKLISTFLVRFILAINTFGVFILSTRYLGAEGRGTISLFVANVTIVQLFSEIIFGSGYIHSINSSRGSYSCSLICCQSPSEKLILGSDHKQHIVCLGQLDRSAFKSPQAF
jgi:hypothetical protein